MPLYEAIEIHILEYLYVYGLCNNCSIFVNDEIHNLIRNSTILMQNNNNHFELNFERSFSVLTKTRESHK